MHRLLSLPLKIAAWAVYAWLGLLALLTLLAGLGIAALWLSLDAAVTATAAVRLALFYGLLPALFLWLGWRLLRRLGRSI